MMTVEEYQDQKSKLYAHIDDLEAKHYRAKLRNDQETMWAVSKEISVQYEKIRKLTDLYVKESKELINLK